jgi:hypothetical protein
MGARNECVEAVLLELERFGLKGEVSALAKHMEIAWHYPDGTRRIQIVPATPSDHRAALNSRGDVRRQLRADNVQKPERPVVSLGKALQLPSPNDFAANRLARLEKDVEGLLDLVVELTSQLAETQARLSNARVITTLSFEAQPVMVPVETPAVPHRKGSRQEGIMSALSNGQWRYRNDIAEEVKADVKLVSACLSNLRAKGLVENGLRGLWRKVPELRVAAQ